MKYNCRVSRGRPLKYNGMTNGNHSPKADPTFTSETFSSLDVSKMTGVSLRQLQWWDEQGVVSPVQRGHRRLYQLHEVIEVGLITELRQKGVSLQKIRRVLNFLKRELGANYLRSNGSDAEMHLLTDGDNLYLESEHKNIVDLLKTARQPMISVCISDQIAQVAARTDKRKGVKREVGSARVRRAQAG